MICQCHLLAPNFGESCTVCSRTRPGVHRVPIIPQQCYGRGVYGTVRHRSVTGRPVLPPLQFAANMKPRPIGPTYHFYLHTHQQVWREEIIMYICMLFYFACLFELLLARKWSKLPCCNLWLVIMFISTLENNSSRSTKCCRAGLLSTKFQVVSSFNSLYLWAI